VEDADACSIDRVVDLEPACIMESRFIPTPVRSSIYSLAASWYNRVTSREKRMIRRNENAFHTEGSRMTEIPLLQEPGSRRGWSCCPATEFQLLALRHPQLFVRHLHASFSFPVSSLPLSNPLPVRSLISLVSSENIFFFCCKWVRSSRTRLTCRGARAPSIRS
jgi:hypothetical protein